MALFEGKTPAERNKMIAAIVLPALAFIFVVRMLFGGSGPDRPAPRNANTKGRPQQTANRNPRADEQAAADEAAAADYRLLTPIIHVRASVAVGDAGRNIFAFYVRPTPTPGSVVVAPTPPPTPTPTPPILLASLAPQSVFAGTGGFTLQITGDKFGPAARVYLDGQEMPTQYRSMQQLSAAVPATAIAGQGHRQVAVRTPDGQFFSNTQVLNVMQPPQPTYTYVGLLKHTKHNTAVLKDQRGELYSVREGDIVEGRFRVVGITERAIQLVDKDLNIKHSMNFIESRNIPQTGRVPGSVQPPPPPAASDDDEP